MFKVNTTDCTITSKTGAGGNYRGNYVNIITSTSGWKNIYFGGTTNFDYSAYKNVEIWVHPASKTTGTITVSFFNLVEYQRVLTVNTWTKVVIDAKASVICV